MLISLNKVSHDEEEIRLSLSNDENYQISKGVRRTTQLSHSTKHSPIVNINVVEWLYLILTIYITPLCVHSEAQVSVLGRSHHIIIIITWFRGIK